MNRIGILVYGAAIAGIILLVGREAIEPSIYLYQNHPPVMVALGIVGWLLATLGPLTLSLWVWRSAHRFRRRWVLHLLFIPGALALTRLGESVLFFASGVPDGDSIEGYTLLIAFGLLVFTLLIHLGALVALGSDAIRRRLNVR